MQKKYKILTSLFLSVILLLAFTLPLNPTAGGWYQQFMPNLGGKTIQDITFLDSLTGFAVTNYANDTSFILKTTNGGDNWFYSHRDTGIAYYYRVKFINQNTGFVGGYIDRRYIVKTTNAGVNWFYINAPYDQIALDMSVINQDMIWIADNGSLTGGVYYTSNGGANWTQQFSGGNQNPNKIYMYNERIGFMSNNSALPNIYKTTNGGANWSVNVSGERFIQMHFVDSLTGWRTRGDTLKFTSNGGINWNIQLMPYGGMIFSNKLLRFSVLNKDTIWGCGGYVLYPNNQVKSILWRTTNRGLNWLFQIPDTSLLSFESFIQFTDRLYGWAYSINPTGIHTTTGGNDTFYTGLQQISNRVPEHFKLYQNYPNPFNPRTIISYELSVTGYVELSVFDITGKHVIDLVDRKQNAGTYEVDFSGNGLSSGVYFYKIIINSGKEVYSDTKKMILIK